MATCRISNRVKPLLVTGLEPVGMYGARPADTIKASGHDRPHRKAGHMTAPNQLAGARQKNPCNAGAVHT